MSEEVLDAAEWTVRDQRHRSRADALVAPLTGAGPHPVWDFLFTYYSLRPGALRRWQPGYGTVLAGPPARRFLSRSGYREHPAGVTVSTTYLRSRAGTVAFVADLLAATASRPARLTCFGLHEWAMVYRTSAVRHDRVPLRLGGAGTDAVVESMPLRCCHFDAYRFFTPAAAARNEESLSRERQLATEQPGCLHAAMDLYKHCYKLGPLIDAELLLDCFALAADARVLDMRASPYDLTGYGFAPIAIETARGRREYVRAQRIIAERAVPLRARLLDRCHRLLDAAA
ncbi:3-methyladenine DNA glycosylase [Mycobacterium sp. MYCO198283]|uniref:3-methyladenine DNA glycosylase n=1 Tax=Mycobacterium sp. MYCO198283 TaxID=2883505 RepID=UPI001E5B5C34|nr:3-methyladenine DNA glycosylase [Mycobacterium sp. MYCO198283]MCG5433193.1 3-methyladenine DNA glycosylase [Mycobacterium sp. MYCO198283]